MKKNPFDVKGWKDFWTLVETERQVDEWMMLYDHQPSLVLYEDMTGENQE